MSSFSRLESRRLRGKRIELKDVKKTLKALLTLLPLSVLFYGVGYADAVPATTSTYAVQGNAVGVGPGGIGDTQVLCNPADFATGGGLSTSLGGNGTFRSLIVHDSFPISDASGLGTLPGGVPRGWRVLAFNPTATNLNVEPFVVCMSPVIVAGSTISTYVVKGSVLSVAPGSIRDTQVLCNPGDSATGGGFSTSVTSGVFRTLVVHDVFSISDASGLGTPNGGVPHGSRTVAFNPTDSSLNLVAIAVCTTPVTVGDVTTSTYAVTDGLTSVGSGGTGDAQLLCNAGDFATGGGASTSVTGGTFRSLILHNSFPISDASGLGTTTGQTPHGWRVLASNPTDTSLNLVPDLICMSPAAGVALDTDADGLPDSFELSPANQALGMDPCRKTVAVEIDYMVPIDLSHSHKPQQAALDMVVEVFDDAPVLATLPCPYAGLGFPRKMTGVQLIIDMASDGIDEQTVLSFGVGSPETFETIKATNFSPARLGFFHYSLWVHDLDVGSSVSGIGELHGDDFIVSLGEWTNQVGTVDEQAGTFAHELGHNLGLGHGGGDATNFKSNYLSVMSYAFQVVGITSPNPDGSISTKFDYSDIALPSLTETALVESAGIGDGARYTSWMCPDGTTRSGLGNEALDWNCNKPIDSTPVAVDINGDASLGVLAGYNDWANLDYILTDDPELFDPGAHCLPEGKELDRVQALVIQAYWEEFSSLTTSKFFTDSSLNPLPSDDNGNPVVDVVLTNGRVASTNPGEVLAWVNVTNTAGDSVQSLAVDETLPVDWTAHPDWLPGRGAIHVFFESVDGSRVDITTGSSVAVSEGNPQTVEITIDSLNATAAGKPLEPGESILLSVKILYGLKGTSQSAATYPRNYTDTATATSFSRPMFEGTSVFDTVSSFFLAQAKVLGDVNRDFRVDLLDLAAAAYSYESTPGSPRWNSNVDLDRNDIVNILDVATVAFYYGNKA